MKKELLSWIFPLLLTFALVTLITTFVGQPIRVSGQSMENTLQNHNYLIMDKISYQFDDPRRFDIVIFPPHDSGKYYIKRIIGLPGETIQIDHEGNIYINGSILEEHYGKERIRNPGRAVREITLGDDEYFVMGDNRNNSTDSRFSSVGNVKRSQIIGKASLRVWPPSIF